MFDISKAFDQVWHDGLLFKMIKMKLPKYLIYWTAEFLSNRNFYVDIENSHSDKKKIKCGVPQGSVLSPLLFNIYINDIPLENKKNFSFSSLFADDLATSFIFRSDKFLERDVNSYLLKMSNWLQKWRLNMNPNKCSYTIFSNSPNVKKIIKFSLFGSLIPRNFNPKFLVYNFG